MFCSGKFVTKIPAVMSELLSVEEKWSTGIQLRQSATQRKTIFFYFTGIVDAEMKMCTSYNLKLILNKQGEVVNGQCECPVGKGIHATCKHVTAILLVLVELRNLGRLNVKKSCTETLQGFQKPRKSHGGSPMKVESLSLEKSFHGWNADPRKPHYKNRPSY